MSEESKQNDIDESDLIEVSDSEVETASSEEAVDHVAEDQTDGGETIELDLDQVIEQNIPIEIEIEGDLVLKEEIGEGYYGAVYRVGDEDDNVDFAVKSLPAEISSDPELLENVKMSFDQASELNHPSIACTSHLHEVVDDSPVAQELGVGNGSQLIVMEYIEGQTVHEWSRQFMASKVDFESALEVCSKVAEALDYAHEHGVVHQYIKPENIMITVEGEVKILDFGIASAVHSSMNQFSTESNKGKVQVHLAPEQWAGKRTGAATDQYALATMFYELIGGAVPFASALNVGVDVMRSCILNDSPEPLEELNKPQWCALKKGLSKNPEDRYKKCIDMFRAIRSHQSNSTSSGEGDSLNELAPRIALLVALVVAAIIIFTVATNDKDIERAGVVSQPSPA